jgi:hypothetical protein
MPDKGSKDKSAAGWFGRNEKVIRWGTMIGSWIAGGVLAATGVGTGLGIAIIAGGTTYGAGKPLVSGLLEKRAASKADKAVTGDAPNNP